MLRIYLPRNTLRRALFWSSEASTQSGTLASSSTPLCCGAPVHNPSLRIAGGWLPAGLTTRQVPRCAAWTRHFSSMELKPVKQGHTAAPTTSDVEDKCHSTRLGMEIRKAAGDFEALAELVQRETVPTFGRRKLRFTMANCITWMRIFSDLEDSSLHQGRPRLEVSLLLAHLMDLIDAMRPDVDAKRLASIARRVSTLKYEGGAREAVLGRVVKACLRTGLKGCKPIHMARLETAFATAGYDPGMAMTELLRATPEERLRIAEEEASMWREGAKERRRRQGKAEREEDEEEEEGEEVTRRQLAASPPCPTTLTVLEMTQLLIKIALRLSLHPGEEWAGAVAKEYTVRGFAGLEEEHLGNLLCALALCNHRVDDAFLDRFYAHVEAFGWGSFHPDRLARILWGLVAMDVRVEEGLLRETVKEVDRWITLRKASTGLLDVAGFYLYLRRERSEVDGELEEGLRLVKKKLWSHTRGSPAQKTLYKMLCERYDKVEWEGRVDMLSIDMIIHLPDGRKVAVELDGPKHFFRNRPTEPTGRTRLKRRLLDEAVRRGVIHSWVWVCRFEDSDVEKIDEAVRAAHTRHVVTDLSE